MLVDRGTGLSKRTRNAQEGQDVLSIRGFSVLNVYTTPAATSAYTCRARFVPRGVSTHAVSSSTHAGCELK
jgi:hypothetical protein